MFVLFNSFYLIGLIHIWILWEINTLHWCFTANPSIDNRLNSILGNDQLWLKIKLCNFTWAVWKYAVVSCLAYKTKYNATHPIIKSDFSDTQFKCTWWLDEFFFFPHVVVNWEFLNNRRAVELSPNQSLNSLPSLLIWRARYFLDLQSLKLRHTAFV